MRSRSSRGPIVEVHLSDIERREQWRRHTVIADVVSHRISGRGAEGYRDAFAYLAENGRMNYRARVERLAAGLAGREIDALLITDLTNVRYLTGYTGSNGAVVASPSRRRLSDRLPLSGAG